VGTSRFPYIPEFIAGVWPWYLNPGELYDEEFVTKAALMHGIKGFSRYMLVERNKWTDSPIRSDGRVREDHAAMFGRVNEILQQLDWVNLRRQADVLLMANRQYDRLEAASVLLSFPGDFLETPSTFSEYPSFMTVSEDTLGFKEPIQMAKASWFAACYDGLTETGFPFLLSDTALAPARWSRYKGIVLSSFEYMAAALQSDLLAYARSGGTLVLGPRLPELDENMEPNNTLAAAVKEAGQGESLASGGTAYQVGSGRIVLLTDLSNAAAALKGALQGVKPVSFRRNDKRLDVSIHTPVSGGGRLVVFVANPTAEQINAEVSLNEDLKSVREVWEDREVQAAGGAIRETLPAYSIKIYECTL
jgi:beta-galactosidase